MTKLIPACVIFLGLLAWTGCDSGHDDHGPHDHGSTIQPSAADLKKGDAQEPAAKPYPLKICVVSGEELGKMGEPKRIVYEGQEIKFCCPSCEKEFRKDAAKFL